MPQDGGNTAKILKTLYPEYVLLENCQRGQQQQSRAEPVPDVSVLITDQVEGRSSRDSDQKLLKNTVFSFKTFISAKSLV